MRWWAAMRNEEERKISRVLLVRFPFAILVFACIGSGPITVMNEVHQNANRPNDTHVRDFKRKDFFFIGYVWETGWFSDMMLMIWCSFSFLLVIFEGANNECWTKFCCWCFFSIHLIFFLLLGALLLSIFQKSFFLFPSITENGGLTWFDHYGTNFFRNQISHHRYLFSCRGGIFIFISCSLLDSVNWIAGTKLY